MLSLILRQHLLFVGIIRLGGSELTHADQSADENADGVDGRDELAAVRQSPLGSDHADQPCDGRQGDQRNPLEHLICSVGQQVVKLGLGVLVHISHLLKCCRSPAPQRLNHGAGSRSAEPLSWIDGVRRAQAVALCRCVPAGSVDLPQVLARADHVRGRAIVGRSLSGGRGDGAVVGDRLADVDPVDVAGRHAPRGGRLEAGALGDGRHGVAGADRVGAGRRAGHGGLGRGSATELGVDDRHDGVVVAAETVDPLLAVAVVSVDDLVGQHVEVGRRLLRGLVDLRRRRDGAGGASPAFAARDLLPGGSIAVEAVEVERAAAVDIAGAGVLRHAFAGRSAVPRAGLVSGRQAVGVLRHPEHAPLSHPGVDLPDGGALDVDDGPDLRAVMHSVDPCLDPCRIAPVGVDCRAAVSSVGEALLPVESEDGASDAPGDGVDEGVGLRRGVAAVGEVVDAGLLAGAVGVGQLCGVVVVAPVEPLRGLDDDEVGRDGGRDVRRLVTADVDAVEVGHRGRRHGHGYGHDHAGHRQPDSFEPRRLVLAHSFPFSENGKPHVFTRGFMVDGVTCGRHD